MLSETSSIAMQPVKADGNYTAAGYLGFELFGSFYLVLLDILVFASNGCVIFLICRTKKLRSLSGAFMFNLAAADIMVGISVVPSVHAIVHGAWTPADGWCRAFGLLTVASCSSSTWALCLVSVERYVAIFYPFRRTGCRRCVVYAPVAMWLYSIGHGAVLLVYDDGYVLASSLYICGPNARRYPVFVIALEVLDVLLPSAIMVFSYASIYREARRHTIAIQSLNVYGKPANTLGVVKRPALAVDEKIVRKATIVVIIITGTFNLCWLPFGTALVALAFGYRVLPKVLLPLFWIALTNSAINPVLYAILNRHYREEARDIFGCCGRASTKSAPGVQV